MVDIQNKKVGSYSMVDALSIGASKIGSEMIFNNAPFIKKYTQGTNVKTGLIKAGVAMVIQTGVGRNKFTRPILSGMIIDAMEDVVIGVRRGLSGQGFGFGMISSNNNSTNSGDVGAF